MVSYSRRLAPPIVAATVATISLTGFAIMALVQQDNLTNTQLFHAIWPILLPSTVAVILVMSFLYRALVEMIEELEAREVSAQHQALHDQLTGLANRALLEDRLLHALQRQHRKGERAALLMLDLDRFKQINDTLGHGAGDELIRQVGSRLSAIVRDVDTVARIGGDEFAILVHDPQQKKDVQLVCEKLINAINSPFDLQGVERRVGASIGAVMAASGDSASELLRKADITMYRAKAAGRNCFRLFSDEMDETVQRRSAIEAKLRRSLGTGEGINLHYQPVMNKEGIAVGLEALLRLRDPELGAISPVEAIPVAEECGLIGALGEQVFRRACEVAKRYPYLRISVNLSPAQFAEPALADRLKQLAVEAGVACAQLELEITENLFIHQGEDCARIIKRLREHGFSIALDDFGTGYSSLGYLRRFRVDAVKLDRSFIETAQEDCSIAIIRAAVTLGHAMRLRVVAEGVASQAQERVAGEAGCDELQGNLYSPAIHPDALDDWISSHSQPVRLRA